MRLAGWILLGVIGWLPLVAISIRGATPPVTQTELVCSSLDKHIMTLEETMAADELTYHIWRFFNGDDRLRVGCEVNLHAIVRLEPAFATVLLKVRDASETSLGCIRQRSNQLPFDWKAAATAALMGIRKLLADWPDRFEA